jgi:hypothetical protein
LKSLLFSLVLVSMQSFGQSPLRVLDEPFPATGLGGIDVLGDFDGDGDVDAASLGSLYLNDGGGGFVPFAEPTLAPPLYLGEGEMRAADLNGDGLDDLIMLYGAIIALQVNPFGGGFVAVPNLPAITAPGGPVYPTSVDVGDVDGDGDLDVVFGTTVYPGSGILHQAGPLTLWLNDGAGGFSAPTPPAFPATTALGGACLLRDFDGDGDLDAIFGVETCNSGLPVSLFVNDGTANFGAAVAPTGLSSFLVWLDTAEFDGDGRPDLFGIDLSARVYVSMNGPGGLGPATMTPFVLPPFIRASAVDVDGDGKDELLGLGVPGFAIFDVALNGTVVGPSTQSFDDVFYAPGSARSGAAACRDLDGDGDRDVMMQKADGSMPMLMNTSLGGFHRLDPRVKNVALQYAVLGDFDGDGDLDACDFAGGVLNTALNDGHGFFAAGPVTPLPYGTIKTLAAFDRDGDGDDDLYGEGLTAAGAAAVWTDVLLDCVGGGAFTLAAAPAWTPGASNRVFVDWDGDGDLDQITGGRDPIFTPAQSYYLRNLGSGVFAAPLAIGTPHLTHELCRGDFDGDGAPDVLQVNYAFPTPDPSSLFLNVGGSYFEVPLPGVSARFAAAGDLNGDGISDFVADSTVYLSTGGAVTAVGTLPSAPLNKITLVDLDLDGDLDLLEAPATAMMNLGGGVFGPPESALPRTVGVQYGFPPRSSIADLDQDGDPDVLASGPRVVCNALRQLTHHGQPRLGASADVRLYGTPGAPWFFFAATAASSFALPPYGTVLIDPFTAVLLGVGVHAPAPSGVGPPSSLSFAIPNVPSLVGATFYAQALDAGSGRLTNRLTTTIVDY